MPLDNFPSGCKPVFTSSFEDAVKEARKRTNEGILVIDQFTGNVKKDYCNILYKLNENGKEYHKKKNDFEEGENPYKFLKEGNILIIDAKISFGFDWSTVILIIQAY